MTHCALTHKRRSSHLICDSTTSNQETFLQDFIVILNHLIQNYHKILKNGFLITTCIVMYITALFIYLCVTRCKRVRRWRKISYLSVTLRFFARHTFFTKRIVSDVKLRKREFCLSIITDRDVKWSIRDRTKNLVSCDELRSNHI